MSTPEKPCGCEESQALRLALYRALAALVQECNWDREDELLAQMDVVWYQLTAAQRALVDGGEAG